MARYLSWNVYHGTIVGVTPTQRIGQIVTLGMANAVDVICLSEVPSNILQAGLGFGAAGGTIVPWLTANVVGWAGVYTALQALAENNPNSPRVANTADGYLIFYRTATFPNPIAAFGYYQAWQFYDLTGTFLRPPVTVTLNGAGGNVTVMNWHADVAAPQVTSALAALNGLLGKGQNRPNPTAVLGDFNYAGPLNNAFPVGAKPFSGWDDWSTDILNAMGNPISGGLDHIITSVVSTQALANVLTFKSDAYHFPLAVDF